MDGFCLIICDIVISKYTFYKLNLEKVRDDMDIGTSYKIKAIDENIDITKYLDAINELDLPSFIAGDTYISTLDTGGETEFEEVWDTARKLLRVFRILISVLRARLKRTALGRSTSLRFR